VSPNTVFPLSERPQNPVTEQILEHPRVTHDVADGVLVMAIKDELLVLTSVRDTSSALNEALSKIARNAGSLAQKRRGVGDNVHGMGNDVEIWRLNNPEDNSIDQARRLRALVREEHMTTRTGPSPLVPAVSPNHVCVVSPFDACPAGPPHPSTPPHECEHFVKLPEEGEPCARVVVIDTGYMHCNPPHHALDERVTSVAGEWLNTATNPATWLPDPPDVADADHDGRLDGVAGHGTFIAGLVAHHCRQVEITVVGQRHEVTPLTDPPDPVEAAMLFSTEFDVANAVLEHANADVISCGFAFPTLDDYPSIPFTTVMQTLTGPAAPRPGVAVVAPAGNERSARPYWPAALPDVIGVASTNRRGNARAFFSNWGAWADCCARGQDVLSTFIDWLGPIDGEPLTDIEDFRGWARWDGTSFATPKVAAAIARLVAESGGALRPVDAFETLLGGAGGVAVTPLTDMTLSAFPGVTLPHLHLG
jgi:hypothetical protein